HQVGNRSNLSFFARPSGDRKSHTQENQRSNDAHQGKVNVAAHHVEIEKPGAKADQHSGGHDDDDKSDYRLREYKLKRMYGRGLNTTQRSVEFPRDKTERNAKDSKLHDGHGQDAW